MSVHEVRPVGRAGEGTNERARVILLAVLIVGAIAVYAAFRASEESGTAKNLLPYQTLARTLPDAEQVVFRSIRQGLLEVEAQRARLSRWPPPGALASAGVAPFSNVAAFTWQQFTQGVAVSYVGLPADPAAPAWMLTIQEPEPNAPPDPSPNDDEHHRLPDGTTLHIYVWMHQYGGRVKPAFVPQPEADGWTQVFSVPPNPILPARPAPPGPSPSLSGVSDAGSPSLHIS
jgi:hypothetical protein